MHSTVTVIDGRRNRIELINDGALRVWGNGRELLGLDIQHLYQGGKNEVAHLRLKLLEERVIQDYETELVRKDHSHVAVNVSLSGLLTNDGKLSSILAICKDITRQKQLEKELKELSSKDSLTGLFNQRCFYDRIEDEMERAKRQGRPLSLVLFDIDKFKGYNDSRGHLAGDKALQAAAGAIMRSTRTHVDAGFRYGGDEFTVMLPESDERQAETTWNIHTFEGQGSTIDVELGALTAAANWTKTLIHGGRDDVRIEARGIGHRVSLDGAGGFVETF